MLRVTIPKFLAILISLFFLTIGFAYSYDDGFPEGQKVSGEHFTVYCATQVDAVNLAQRLNIGFSDRILAGENSRPSAGAGLAGMLDTLFLRVCNILDMNLYSYQGTIKVCRDYAQLEEIYKNLFSSELGGKYSFYVYNLNTIYISAERFRSEILGHEMAHAIISHFFVVQPPVKIQEVLAGYVEYQLRKTGQ